MLKSKPHGRDCRHCAYWVGKFPCAKGFKTDKKWLAKWKEGFSFGQHSNNDLEHCFGQDCLEYQKGFVWVSGRNGNTRILLNKGGAK